MFDELMKRYSEELIETLNAKSLVAYDNFIEKWHNYALIDNKTYRTYKESDRTTKMNSYCTLILKLPNENITDEAKKWAKSRYMVVKKDA